MNRWRPERCLWARDRVARIPALLIFCVASTVALGCGDSGGDAGEGGGADVGVLPDGGSVGGDAGADVGSDGGEIGADAGIDASTDPDCVSNERFFAEQVWPDLMNPVCGACHTPQGIARDTEMVFVSAAVPTYLGDNLAIIEEVSRLERDGVSLLLLKPTNMIEHGGGAVLDVDSEGYALLEEVLERRDNPIVCADDGETNDDDLILLDEAGTLRKATIHLSGRLPTEDELATVAAGGEDALRNQLAFLLTEEGYFQRLRELFNDEMLSDAYLNGQDALSLLDNSEFPDRYFHESFEDDGTRRAYRDAANDSLARQPLELLVHIARQNRPLTELLTAQYTMVNDFSARALGITNETPSLDDPNAYVFREAIVAGHPHAGVLTMPTFLARFPSTDTNRNRHRSRIFFDRFLATDLLALAERPIDAEVSAYHNPTLNDPQCTVCHGIMDPVAGAFQNWDNDGDRRIPEDGWYPDLTPPGFDDQLLPGDQRQSALQWLANQTVDDPRFGLAMTRMVFTALIGQEPVTLPPGEVTPERVDAYEAQRAYLDDIAQGFIEANYSLNYLVIEIILSPWFRAVDDFGADPGLVSTAGTARFRSPELLARAVDATTGYPWRNNPRDTDYLLGTFRTLYGGIDSRDIISRIDQPNGIIVSIAERMAVQVACRHVPRDFVLAAEQRTLFPHVEMSFVPETPEGFDIPQAQEAIRANLVHLHAQLLGETLEPTDPEITASYNLFYDTWQEGVAGINADEIGTGLPWQCIANRDWWTNENLGDREVRNDGHYTARAWMAVLTYLLTDYHFLYE